VQRIEQSASNKVRMWNSATSYSFKKAMEFYACVVFRKEYFRILEDSLKLKNKIFRRKEAKSGRIKSQNPGNFW
jgi:hypothetical protein